MKLIRFLILSITASVLMISCSSSKTLFTPEIRTRVENGGIKLDKIQFRVFNAMPCDRHEVVRAEQGYPVHGRLHLAHLHPHSVDLLVLEYVGSCQPRVGKLNGNAPLDHGNLLGRALDEALLQYVVLTHWYAALEG